MSADEKSALNLLGHKEFRLRHRDLGALWKPAKTASPKSVTVRKLSNTDVTAETERPFILIGRVDG